MEHVWWGLRVKAMRKALSLTQSELADQIGSTQEIISRIERGRQAPGLIAALALADALGCPVEILFSLPSSADNEKAAA